MTAFSPTGSNEVNAIHEDEGDFGLLSEEDIKNLSYGISRVLAFYENLGHLSFNYSLFSVRRSSSEEGFRCLLKIINRQNLCPNYRNDDLFPPETPSIGTDHRLTGGTGRKIKRVFLVCGACLEKS